MANRVLNHLTQVTNGVSLHDTSAGSLTPVVQFTVPRGTAVVIPAEFVPLLELIESGGAEMSGNTEIYFGIKTPDDLRRIRWLGGKYMYRAWADLTLAQQQSDEYRRACMIDLGVPFLPLTAEEVLVIALYHATESCDAGSNAAHITFSLPYFERTPTSISVELGERMGFLGV
jgi:hypothetical protein